MKKVFIVLFFMLQSISITAQDLSEKTDKLMKDFLDLNLFSGTILIAENGTPIYHKAFGFSDIEGKVGNEISTKFNFGSVGKMFTGVAILKLAEKGKLNLDDAIGKYLEYFPKDISDKVTIRHLLKHEGGLGDYLSDPNFRQNIDNFKTLDDLMNLIKEEPLLFEPGTKNSYSNSGYATLGAVIEAVTNKSFYNAIEDIILKPLELNDTYYSKVDLVRNKVVKYSRDFEGKIERTPFQDWPSPAGGEYSTVHDLMKFIQGIFYSDKILSENSRALFLNRFDKENQTTFQQILQNEKFVPMWAGGAPGVNAAVLQFISKNITVTVLSNYSPPAAMDVAQQIRSIIETGNYSAPKIPVEEKIYEAYQKNGADYIEVNFAQLTVGYSIRGPKDTILNQLGYNLLGVGKTDDAIKIFEVNTRLFPQVANTFDSLGEAFMMKGDKTQALKNYKKVLEINPDDSNAMQKVKELEGNK